MILPVASYGCQVWLPYTNIIKGLAANGDLTLSKAAQDPIERVHLPFLKWTMSVGEYTSNTAVWGDTGRYPLAIELSSQVFSYFDRLKQMDTAMNPAFVRHAFAEQKALQLSWYKVINEGRSKLEKLSGKPLPSPLAIKEALQSSFIEQWEKDRLANRKLSFYNTIKKGFSCEEYLCMDLASKQSKSLAQLRTSSHKFNIETGRYGPARYGNVLNRLCYQCCDEEAIKHIAELPFFEPTYEDETHVLQTCPHYNDIRDMLSETAKTSLFNDLATFLTDRRFILEAAKTMVRINERRFPKKMTSQKAGNN